MVIVISHKKSPLAKIAKGRLSRGSTFYLSVPYSNRSQQVI